jgi:excisionase family DNA binding protein
MTATTQTDDRPPRPLLGIAEVAGLLGVDIRHVRRLVHERRIPYIKWGHLLRFDLAEIEAWIDEFRRPGRP